jgi:sulfur carrier protein ThiS
MTTISFTSNLRRHVDCPPAEVHGASVAECLAAYFEHHPNVRSYVLDEQGSVRRHVVVFVDAEQITDPSRQTDPVRADGEITVMQALSGG